MCQNRVLLRDDPWRSEREMELLPSHVQATPALLSSPQGLPALCTGRRAETKRHGKNSRLIRTPVFFTVENAPPYRGRVVHGMAVVFRNKCEEIARNKPRLLCKGWMNGAARCHQLWGEGVWLCKVPLKIYPLRQKIRQWPGVLDRETYVQAEALFLRVHVINLKTIQNQVQYQKVWTPSEVNGKAWTEILKGRAEVAQFSFWCDVTLLVSPRWMKNCLYLKPARPAQQLYQKEIQCGVAAVVLCGSFSSLLSNWLGSESKDPRYR